MAALFSLLVGLRRAAFRARRGHFDDEDDHMSALSIDAVVNMEKDLPPRDPDALDLSSGDAIVWGPPPPPPLWDPLLPFEDPSGLHDEDRDEFPQAVCCEICSYWCNGPRQWEDYKTGKKQSKKQ